MRTPLFQFVFCAAAFAALMAPRAVAAQCLAVGDPCDDGLFCTVSDSCNAALACTGSPRGCADSNDCTIDSCNETVDRCDNADSPRGTACADALYCTVNTACDGAGSCVGGEPRTCDDGLACTTDSCNESGSTCQNELDGGWCRITGDCVAEGTVDPRGDSLCDQCVPSLATNRYSQAPAGTLCGAPSCIEGNLLVAPVCDAIGECPPTTPVPCASGTCSTTTSCSDCTTDADCAADEHCSGTECVGAFDLGTSCDRSAQCLGGECYDGVCCAQACGGGCESCNATDAEGLCTPHASGTDPEGACGSGLGCDGFGDCVSGTDSSVDADARVGADGSAPGLGLAAHGSGCIACSVGAAPPGRDLRGLVFSALFAVGLALRRRR